MTEYFSKIPEIKFEDEKSINPFAFKFYDENKKVLGKSMKEHLGLLLVIGIHLLGLALIHLVVKHLIDHGCKQVMK